MQTQSVTGIKNYTDRELYSGANERCVRWIICYPEEIHQVIVSPNTKTVFSLQIIPSSNLFERSLSEIKTLLEQFTYHQDEFTQVNVVIADPKYTFVPEALFDANQAATYYKLIHPLPRLHSVHYQKGKDTVCVYAMHDLFHNALRIALPGVIFHHYSVMLSGAFQSMYHRKHEQRIYVHLFEKGMDVFRFQKGVLSFHNYFPFESDTDVVYFLLSLAETLNTQQEETEIMLCGKISQDDPLVALMRKYIPNVNLLKRPSHLQFPPVFRTFQEQQHFIDFSGL